VASAAKAAAGAVAALVFLIVACVAAIAGLLGAAPPAAPTRYATADIPPRMLVLYRKAAFTCPGLPWTVLAAIGKAETDHGRARRQTSTAGAVGPMQFLPATFAAYARPVPPGGARPPTPWDPVDAVYAAARLLCSSGARGGRHLAHAVYAYNHSAAYVRRVLALAARYAHTQPPPPSPSRTHAASSAAPTCGAAPDEAASTAPASPRPPTAPPRSACRAPPSSSTTPDPASHPAPNCAPATSSSTDPAPTTSPTPASTPHPAP
jgi:hypothetical protein